LTVSLRQVRQARVQNQLADAMVSSSVIDHAIGILMGQQRCTATVAFDIPRRVRGGGRAVPRDAALPACEIRRSMDAS
jgi:hypothetical protein